MPIEFIRPTINEARSMWEMGPFKYPADLEREGKRTRLAVARYISEFQDSAVCICSQISTTFPATMIADPHCPVHGGVYHVPVCTCILSGIENCPVHGSSKPNY